MQVNVTLTLPQNQDSSLLLEPSFLDFLLTGQMVKTLKILQIDWDTLHHFGTPLSL